MIGWLGMMLICLSCSLLLCQMRGLVYIVRSDEYPDCLVQVQIEKLRARSEADKMFNHVEAEVERLVR